MQPIKPHLIADVEMDDVANSLSEWSWLLHGDWSPLLVSAVGDVFLINSAGAIALAAHRCRRWRQRANRRHKVIPFARWLRCPLLAASRPGDSSDKFHEIHCHEPERPRAIAAAIWECRSVFGRRSRFCARPMHYRRAMVGVACPILGIPTFLGLPHAPGAADLDIALVGVPMDLGVSNRPGARFGPRAVRNVERIGPYHQPLRGVPQKAGREQPISAMFHSAVAMTSSNR